MFSSVVSTTLLQNKAFKHIFIWTSVTVSPLSQRLLQFYGTNGRFQVFNFRGSVPVLRVISPPPPHQLLVVVHFGVIFKHNEAAHSLCNELFPEPKYFTNQVECELGTHRLGKWTFISGMSFLFPPTDLHIIITCSLTSICRHKERI